ncbi:MAG: fibronectin type III domain-containing protein [Patescibacteria group bacterium]|nr:fibronectin type III domain-containing protein [Patescibacteria group bacterium]
MNSVEAKKGFKTFLLMVTGVLTLAGAYKGIPAGYKHFIEAQKETVEIKNLRIESLTPTAVTLSWETEEEEGVGFVQYGTAPTQLERTAPETSPLVKHRITIEGLKPQTTYYYKVGMDGKLVSDEALQVTTPAQ